MVVSGVVLSFDPEKISTKLKFCTLVSKGIRSHQKKVPENPKCGTWFLGHYPVGTQRADLVKFQNQINVTCYIPLERELSTEQKSLLTTLLKMYCKTNN